MRSKQLARISPTVGLKWSPGKHQHLNRNEEKVRKEKASRYVIVGTNGNRQNSKGLSNWDRWDGSLWRTEDLGHYHQSWHLPQTKHAQDGIDAVLRQMLRGRLREVDQFWLLHHQAALNTHMKIDRFYKLLSEMCAVAFLLRTAPTKISERFTETLHEVGSFTMALSVEVGHLRIAQTALAHVQHNPHYSKFLTSLYRTGAEFRDFQYQLIVKRKAYRFQFKEFSRHEGRDLQINESSRHEGRDLQIIYDQEHRDMIKKYMNIREKKKIWLNSSKYLQSYSISESIARPFALAVAKNEGRVRVIIHAFIEFLRNGSPEGPRKFLHKYRTLCTSMEENIRSMALTSHDLTALRYYRARKFPTSISEKELELHKSLHELTRNIGSNANTRLPFPGSEGRPPQNSNKKATEASRVGQYPAPTQHQGLTEKRVVARFMGAKRVKTEKGQSNEPASESSQKIVKARKSQRTSSGNISMHQIQPKRSSVRELDGTVYPTDTVGGLRKEGKKVFGNFKGSRKVLIDRETRQIEGEMVTTPQTQPRPMPLKERGESANQNRKAGSLGEKTQGRSIRKLPKPKRRQKIKWKKRE